MKKLFSLLAAAALVASSLIVTASPASAEEGNSDVAVKIGKITVKDVVISSAKCKTVPFSISYSADPGDTEFDEVQAWFGVTRGKTAWQVVLADLANQGVIPDRISAVEEPIQWCPGQRDDAFSGLGKFRVEGVELFWWYPGAADDAPPDGYAVEARTAAFTVKQASKASSAKVTKKGTKRTLSAKFTYFDVSKKAWKVQPKGTKVELQRRAANGSGSWKKIKTVKVGSKGAVKTTYQTKSKYQYRFVYAGTSTKAPVTSKTLKK